MFFNDIKEVIKISIYVVISMFKFNIIYIVVCNCKEV